MKKAAINFMRKHAPNERINTREFCYPLLSLGPTYAAHSNGVVHVMVPNAPGPKDSLIYVSKGARVPDSPFGLRHLTGSWYYERVQK